MSGRPSQPDASASDRFWVEVETMIEAAYPALYLVSFEEDRVESGLRAMAERRGANFVSWSSASGLTRFQGPRRMPLRAATADPMEALLDLRQMSGPLVVVLKDFHPFLEQHRIVRALRETIRTPSPSPRTFVLLSPRATIPVELEKELSVLDVPLPEGKELRTVLIDLLKQIRRDDSAEVALNRDEAELLVQAARGLTLREARYAFARAVAHDGRLAVEDIQLVLDEKKQIIRKSGLLDYYPPDASLASVGGLSALKAWLAQRKDAFSDAARAFGVARPKGLLLLGVQGCGKSLTARAIASEWALPLLRLEMGRIYGSLVGSSEDNLRRAIQVAESIAPAVLWLDELEKGVAGSQASGQSDGGVAARVFGSLLTWMQEKTAPVFVVATANRIDALPPELLRKGRFDEIFFVDLPSHEERAQIFSVHLTARGRAPDDFDLDALSVESCGYSGAEIEQAVNDALYVAFHGGQPLETATLQAALRATVPLSQTLGEEIQRLRAWARHRTRSASGSGADGGA